MKLKMTRLLLVGVVLSLCLGTVSCRTTGAHGVVIDQNGSPVRNCEMEASWISTWWWFIMMPPMSTTSFRADSDGKWRFHKLFADDLDIAARPPNGYEVFGHVRVFTAGSFQNGQCPTNDFVLRLRKISKE